MMEKQLLDPALFSRVINILTVMNKEKKKQKKKKRVDSGITLRVISRPNAVTHLLFFYLFLLSDVLF